MFCRIAGAVTLRQCIALSGHTKLVANKKEIEVKKFLIVISMLISAPAFADYVWVTAVPTEVHMVSEGLMLVGDFDTSGVPCATGRKAILLQETDKHFDRKVSIALIAHSSKKKITALVNNPGADSCTQISAHGWVPIVYHYYWQLKD
jgi:hypothetical protein